MEFIKPDFDFEWNEANRYDEFKNIGKTNWIKKAQKGSVIMYSEIKDVLSNTDLDFNSLENDKKTRFEKAIQSNKVELPIVVKFHNQDYDLVSGNTRLAGLVNMYNDSPLWLVDLSK